MTLDLLATHGTCSSYANLICKENFRICDGRHGAGVYFWHASPNFDDAVDLARSYAEFNLTKGAYDGVDETEPCVLACNILLNKNNFLDLESIDYLGVLRAYLLKFDAKLKAMPSRDVKAELTKIYNGFFQELEEISNEKIIVYHVKAAVPQNYKDPKSKGLQWATQFASSCLVVRENSVIPLASIRRI
ncbi:hypothetical protein QTA56_18140 [Acinetobacter sp. VNH17]|jgi:hypothetical protein|uniref:Uncharacterized protein n=1 Tax=Acinetobacter thutiue TaxID=2998078 RepID=A0ABT7WUD1_9GAMM|nr:MULTISPECIES: hypothetical protein [Acinetobacter]MCY6414020.1 hypothetical protein [Acinetobacter thutiue]MDN0016129.1 hypothetical protein [Acinetobacter thutiue]OTL18861.1 hypothetical protein B9X79_09015 [Acinetobacter pittii]